ncbi:hypothetical protein [Gimesia sp.]|uniref:hypothetical protein n=1 Tax=Gimesia sp. TaxID=2024833 RepID=UPI0032EB15CF
MAFNRYHKWLGISPKVKRPTYYQLLGVDFEEKDIDVIQSAAEKQRSHVQQFEQGENHEEAAQLISEIDDAELTLASPNLRKNYNRRFNLNSSNTRHSGIKSSAGRTVGESSGLFREYLGIMSVILGGFIIMAAASFLLPWQKLVGNNQEENAKPVSRPNQTVVQTPPIVSEQSPDQSEVKQAITEIIYVVEISPQNAELKSDSKDVVISGEGRQRKVVVSNSNEIGDFTLSASCVGFKNYEQRIQIASNNRNLLIQLEPLPTIPKKLSEDRLVAEWVIKVGGKLDIVDSEGHTSEIKAGLPDQPFHISKISLHSLDRITNNDLRRFSQLKHLTSLNLMKTPITDDGLRHLSTISSLESLNLAATQINGSGFQYLADLNNLSTLLCGGCVRITDNSIAHLVQLSNLSCLGLIDTTISDSALQYIGRIQSLKELRLKGIGFRLKISDKGLRYLYGLKSLEKLDVAKTRVTKRGVVAFQRSVRNCSVNGP